MAYIAPYVDAAGLHLPTYAEIRDGLIEEFKLIFGQDVYLENDSQDYQWISAVALKIYDSFQTVQLAYNNRGPGTAIGSGLDGVIKINGLKRKKESASTCQVVLTGTAGTVITGGVVADISGNDWDLPPTVAIGSGGTVTVTAVCQIAGDIAVGVGDIATIVTPTKGWASVTNEVAAIEGLPIETDSQVRNRQTVSVALPSKTVLEGTIGAVAAVSGVTRYKVYENDTNAADANGLPPHSITAVVEGGADADIAQAIYCKKGPGAYTNGDVVTTIIDAYENPVTIRFYRPEYLDIKVTYTLKALTGYTSATTDAIKQAAVDFLNSFDLGAGLLTISGLEGTALSVMPNLAKPLFSLISVTAGVETQAANDIPLSFKQVPQGTVDNITIVLT